MQTKVSIITVCYNSEKTIERTIRSVLDQTYNNIEYIIVDGASKDHTIDIIKKYEPEFNGRMRYVSEPDGGIYYAMNKGIEMSTGELIGIINSDDWYERDAVERVLEIFEKNKENERIIIHGITNAYSQDELLFCARMIPDRLKKGGMGSHPSCFVSRSTYDYIGMFDVRYKFVADYDFMIRAYDSGTVCFLDSDYHIANALLGGASASSKAYRELLRLQGRYRIRSLRFVYIELFKATVSDIYNAIRKGL